MNVLDEPKPVGRADIETIESIQPHGAALVVRLPEWVITHASANLETIFGAEPHAVIDKPLSELMSRYAIHRLRNILQFVMANGEPERLMNVAMGYQRERFDLTLYSDDGRAVIEIEPRQRDQKTGGDDSLFLLRAMRSRLRTAASPQEICERVARHIRSLTGYERVMVFRFLEDGTGEVVAEERRGQLPSRLGFRYGAEDADRQARALIWNARFCYIPDMEFQPSPFVPAPVPTDGLVGLSTPGLRSISVSHASYLRRCGIGATFALTIGPIDAPWGAIVCQNAQARAITSDMRSALDFFANGIALQIGFFATVEMVGEHAAAREARSKLQLDRQLDVEPEESLPALLEALRAHIEIDGIGFWTGTRLAQSGLALTENAAGPLIDLLDATDDIVFKSDALAATVGRNEDPAAGVLSVRVTDNPRRYLLLFRGEERRVIRWGQADGDDPSSVREEIVDGRSASWTDRDVDLAYALRGRLLKTMLRRKNVVEQESSARLSRQEIVIVELNHRVKNLLAVFQSLVMKTGQTASTLEEFRQALAGRIRSLALAHDQMAGDGTSVVPLRHLIEAELAPFATKDHRVVMEGPDLGLAPRALSVLALVIHELATNAEKYGAFSRASGTLAIRWARTEDGGLDLVWEEDGAEPVAIPQRRGFGSTVVERMVPFELKGRADIRYLARGLVACFFIPSEFVVDRLPPSAISTSRPSPAHATRKVAAQRALVVEDNMIIALEAEDMFRRLGFERVDVAAHQQDAERFIRENTYDVVALDLNLGSSTSLALADELHRSGIPFLFATGYGEGAALPERFAGIPIVAKPYSDAALFAALASLIDGKEPSN